MRKISRREENEKKNMFFFKSYLIYTATKEPLIGCSEKIFRKREF